MSGISLARRNLGNSELATHNIETERALEHFMIAARDGDSESLKIIKWLYSIGHATKEDYTKALQSYKHT
jgi:TPR repeat protein